MLEAPYGRSNRWLTLTLIRPEELGADREAVQQVLEEENIVKPALFGSQCICNHYLILSLPQYDLPGLPRRNSPDKPGIPQGRRGRRRLAQIIEREKRA